MPLRIKTSIAESPGKGMGLFTDENLIKGQEIYVDDPLFEKTITLTEKLQMDTVAQAFIDMYAPFNKAGQFYYLNTDNARFWNHSQKPNTVFTAREGTHLGSVYALEDIPAGTELTANYCEFCDNCKDGKWGFTPESD